MSIRVRLFAVARERAGTAEVAVELADGITVADLRSAIGERLPALQALLPNIMIAVNAEYASDDQVIPAGAEVALIPPVSGGACIR